MHEIAIGTGHAHQVRDRIHEPSQVRNCCLQIIDSPQQTAKNRLSQQSPAVRYLTLSR